MTSVLHLYRSIRIFKLLKYLLSMTFINFVFSVSYATKLKTIYCFVFYFQSTSDPSINLLNHRSFYVHSLIHHSNTAHFATQYSYVFPTIRIAYFYLIVLNYRFVTELPCVFCETGSIILCDINDNIQPL